MGISIKGSEHERRTGGAAYTGAARNIFNKRNNKLQSPNEFKTMFKNSGNKIPQQQFLKKEFRLLARQGPTIRFVYSLRSYCWDLSAENEDAQIKEFQCYHIEADTILLYIYSQLRKNGIIDAVVIDAEDTDLIVLAANVAHQINGDLGIKKKGDISDCNSLCSKEVAENIVPLHIHTRADAVSGFYVHGKKSIFQSVVKSEEVCELLTCLGKVIPVTEATLERMALFTIKYVYGDKDSTTFAKARALKWNKMKIKSTQRILPDRESHNLKVKRANCQVYILHRYDKPEAPPTPLELLGWELVKGKCQPLRYISAPLSKNINDMFTKNHCKQRSAEFDSEKESDIDSESEQEFNDLEVI